jgi:hypothetical protein
MAIAASVIAPSAYGAAEHATRVYPSPEAGGPDTHRVSPVANAATDLPSFVCGLLKKPVAAAVNDLVALLSHDRIKGTLAGTIFAEVGFKPFCVGRLQKLESVVKRAVVRPSVPSRVRSALEGPLATNVYVTQSTAYGIGSLAELHWTQYPPGATLTRTILLSENAERYIDVSWAHFPRLIFRGTLARFAIQLHDVYGRHSPWAFSPVLDVP